MLNITRHILCVCAIAVGFSLPAVAQTDSNGSFDFNKIEVGEDRDWEFKSENESASVQDDLGELQEYSLSDVDDTEVRLIKEDRRWGNVGDTEDYSIETEVYGY